MRRATILNDSNRSELNIFTPTSELSYSHPISMDHNRRLINEIVDKIFDDRKGNIDISSSECSSKKLQSSEHSFDKRLKYWKDVLRDRERLGDKIRKQTAKSRSEILYNRVSTVDERDKHTVQRLMDYAQRMEPIRLMNLQPGTLREKCAMETCLLVPEVQETLPRAERDMGTVVEISGIPKVVKTEMMGKPKYYDSEKEYKWLKSKVLEQRIEEIGEDIERVIEYYPDIENLQIVGESLIKSTVMKRSSDIQVLRHVDIVNISSESTQGGLQALEIVSGRLDIIENVDYAMKVNDFTFAMGEKRSSKNVSVEVSFVSQPFERKVKQVLTIKNLGKKVLNFEWTHRSYYEKNSVLLKSLDNEFLFDRRPFRLYSSEMREINILYQPRRVDIVKSKWILKVEPQFFCRKLDGIVMKLSGICNVPPEYEKKILDLQREVIEKSNLTMMRKLTTNLASTTPLIRPVEAACPYQRVLNEMELFEQRNPGYKCERYHDLELLRELYRRVKKPRSQPWNLEIDTLKNVIILISSPKQRALYINELASILGPMKGPCMDLEKRIVENPEKDRTKLVFVRGIICTGIDDWEELTLNLEEAFVKTTLPIFHEEVAKYYATLGEIDSDEEFEERQYPPMHDEKLVRTFVIEKRVRRLKAFRDSLFMQTYTLLCNFIEDIVNIIESTAAV
ncbi:uncharacterized protein LOC119637682 [Glossina fuscipes]|uniref:Uncharacterized protein LOC119637682 n=1 Tax=Glossina fuscipes TaxID=7396 RepID=A0A9C6DSV0_9MUSC|nr:uncharacterized protein LOC119637682 [Glossina fuscipes]KAI9581793.1 hypothetical protein GQX74_010110 [Glossina fuscipes]